VAKIELPESWAGVTEPLRALMAEVECEAHANPTTLADLAAVSARWGRVSDAILRRCAPRSSTLRPRKRGYSSDSSISGPEGRPTTCGRSTELPPAQI
jgi:hypothetical protein